MLAAKTRGCEQTRLRPGAEVASERTTGRAPAAIRNCLSLERVVLLYGAPTETSSGVVGVWLDFEICIWPQWWVDLFVLALHSQNRVTMCS